MLDFLNPIKGFGLTFGTMFKKVTTEQYPEYKRPTAPRYHGRHVLNRHPDGLEKCIGCELCAWSCPADAIYVEGGDNTAEARFSPGERFGAVYQINYLRCIFCGMCIEACPTRALTMSNEYELADDSRQDLIFTKEQLLAPLSAGMELPPHPMRLGEDEQAYYGGRKKAPTSGHGHEHGGGSGGAHGGGHGGEHGGGHAEGLPDDAALAAAVKAGEGEYAADITAAVTTVSHTDHPAHDQTGHDHTGHDDTGHDHTGHDHGADASDR